MKCPPCNADNPDPARYCEDCGARLELCCPSCGQPVSHGKRFCRSCGAALTAEAPAPRPYTPKHLAENGTRHPARTGSSGSIGGHTRGATNARPGVAAGGAGDGMAVADDELLEGALPALPCIPEATLTAPPGPGKVGA